VKRSGLHRRRSPALKTYIEDHFATAHDLRESTKCRYRTDLRTHLMPYLGNVAVSKLTVDAMRKWLRELQASGATPAAVTSALLP